MSKLEKLLVALCSTSTCVHFRALQGQLEWTRPQVREVMLTLHRRGWAEALKPYCWRATNAGRVAHAAIGKAADAHQAKAKAPVLRIQSRPSGFISRVWTGMRNLRKFEIDDLVLVAARERDNVKSRRDETRRFIAALMSAGYLVRMDKQAVRTAKPKYLLLPDKDTGPKVPAIGRGRVIDRNTGIIFQITQRAA